MNEHHPADGERDPLRAAFDDYERPPADIVPRRPGFEHSLDELAALEGQTVTVTSYDLDDDGITKHVERATITRPITGRNTEK